VVFTTSLFIEELFMRTLLLALLILLPLAHAAYCHGKPGGYQVNDQPIWTD
jgi:hypothetical protein